MTGAVELACASEAHRSDLTAYCRRLLGSSFEAEDAVQETLLRAWRGAHRFEGRAPLRAWLYRIATNVCFDALRRRARQPVPVDELPDPGPAGPDDDPAARAMTREDLRLALIVAVDALPRRQRAVLLLRDALSWPAADVAVLLGTSEAAVNSALQRAHAALDRVAADGVAPVRFDSASRRLLEGYAAAFEAEDLAGLVELAQCDAQGVAGVAGVAGAAGVAGVAGRAGVAG